GTPCDFRGRDLPPGTPPPPTDNRPNDWSPFGDRIGYELADFSFTKVQLGKARVDQLFQIIAALCIKISRGDQEQGLPFTSNAAMEQAIDAIEAGDAPCEYFVVRYQGERPATNVPHWMDQEFEVWTRNPLTIAHQHLANPDFNGEWDYAPYREFVGPEGEEKRKYKDFMSANWSWKQCDEIAKDPKTHGAMFVPIIGGSEKTTVSVATGQNDYYPLYQSAGNVHNNVHRAHREAVTLTSFLSVPKVSRQDANSELFRKFCRQLFHSSLATIFEPLKANMTVPDIVMCPDGHYRRVIYGLGPYIADYPEQVLLACVVQNWCPKCTAPSDDLDCAHALPRSQEYREKAVDLWSLGKLWDGYGIVGDIVPYTDGFPRADINELLSMDLLHQLIKGGFKDHLVTWVGEYLEIAHGKTCAKQIMDDIDRRISLAPAFLGIRRFHQGRNFKQWTGDDSKALMKVYVNAIEGHVPTDMVHAISVYLDFCYIARRAELTEDDLDDLDDALTCFHQYRTVFQQYGVRALGPKGFSLPRQHSMKHYRELIEWFGAHNGLCTSITEAKHIKAVKEPWCRSNKYNTLGQMLQINQRIDKMAALRVDLQKQGMLKDSLLEWVFKLINEMLAAEEKHWQEVNAGADVGIDGGVRPVDIRNTINRVRNYPKLMNDIGQSVGVPSFRQLVFEFLLGQFTDNTDPNSTIARRLRPRFKDRVKVFHSVAALFYAPSDPSGIGNMRREYIQSTRSWRSDGERRDCVLVNIDNTHDGMASMEVARILLLFSFKHNGKVYPCALVHWFPRIDSLPDKDTEMWIAEPGYLPDGERELQVIHLDMIIRAVHLLPVFGSAFVHDDMHFTDTLDWFRLFYISKWADHHSFATLYSRDR
ncbi:hypothetical protein OF83DRAFT_1069266, partial [Amylostereum chailletii]